MIRLRLLAYLFLDTVLIAGAITGLGASAVCQDTSEPPATEVTPNQPVGSHAAALGKPGDIEFLDYKDGFRGIKFGTDVSQFSNLQIYRDRGAIKAYLKTDENLWIGIVRAKMIVYVFVNGKFYAVSIYADSTDADGETFLLQAFQAAFGPGTHSDGNPSKYFWTGKIANAHFLGSNVTEDHYAHGWIANNDLQKENNKIMQDLVLEAAELL